MILLPATLLDAYILAANLRFSDEDEWRLAHEAFGGDEPGGFFDAINDGVEVGDAWALWDGPDLVAIMGVVEMPQFMQRLVPYPAKSCCSIWMMGTDLADLRWRGMTRAARRFMAMQAKRWDAMGNIVPKGMQKRLRWIQHLGFDISDHQAQFRDMGFVTFWTHPRVGPKISPAAP